MNKLLTVKRALAFVTACSVALAAECVWLGAKLSDARDDVAILQRMISQRVQANQAKNTSPVAPYLVRPAATMKGTNQ
jgi:hypothetical protein